MQAPPVSPGPRAATAATAGAIEPAIGRAVRDMLSAADGSSVPGTLLGVWAHPDDETYLSGALMAAATTLGARVVCVTATLGELGGQVPPGSPSGSTLAQVRGAELADALHVLGVREHVVLGLPDGGCAEVDPAGPVERIADVIGSTVPAAVVTFGPDGFTGHPDHRAVSGWATTAFERAAPRGARLFHAATTADRRAETTEIDAALGILMDPLAEDGPVVPAEALAAHLRLSGALLDRKVTALRAHASQTTALLTLLGPRRYADWVSQESFVERLVPPRASSA